MTAHIPTQGFSTLHQNTYGVPERSNALHLKETPPNRKNKSDKPKVNG